MMNLDKELGTIKRMIDSNFELDKPSSLLVYKAMNYVEGRMIIEIIALGLFVLYASYRVYMVL